MTNTITVGSVPVTFTERGEGTPVLLLHGGGGPGTVEPWADRLARARHARVLTPVHPGFGGTPRPQELASIGGLAALYVHLLDALDLTGITVVGNSIGGWIAAEMAVLGSDRVSSYVIVDGVGAQVDGHPVVDFFALTPQQIAEHSYYDPKTYGIDPATLPAEAQRLMIGNRAALQTYGGTTMTDATLLGRLATVTAPTLVVWGESDRIADPDYGRAIAAAVPGARYVLLERTGHLPQVETPDTLIDVVWDFAVGPE